VVLEKAGKDTLDRSCKKLGSVARDKDRNILQTFKRRKVN
jgi:hypothetical protein